MNEQIRQQFEAKMAQAKKVLADTHGRRLEYAETVGARWGDELGDLMGVIASTGGAFLKVLTLLVRTNVLPDELTQSLAQEFGALQGSLFDAAIAAYFRDDPKREVMAEAVEVMFKRMMENESSLASYMVDVQEQLSKLINKEN